MADIGAMWNEAPLISRYVLRRSSGEDIKECGADVFWWGNCRTLAASSLVVSFVAHSLNLISPGMLLYSGDRVFNLYRPEVWRVVTTFLLTQPGMVRKPSPAPATGAY